MPTEVPFGQNILGTRNVARDPTKYPKWRYFVSALVVVIGLVYALPNLYQPDFAVQIETDHATTVIGSKFANQAASYLEQEGISVKGAERTDRGCLIRLFSDKDQLRAKETLEKRLNPSGIDRQFVVALNLASTTPQWLQNLYAKPMKLGLDLAGGIHFVLQVDLDSAFAKQMKDEQSTLTGLLREANLRYLPSENFISQSSLTIAFAEVKIRDDAMLLIAESYGPLDYSYSEVDVDGNPGIRVDVNESRLRDIEDVAIEQNLTGLRSRVNELGVSEPLVQRLGSSRIVIDLPGVQDSTEAKRILDKFASLEFRLAAFSHDRAAEVEIMDYRGRQVRIQRANIITGENVVNALQERDPETSLPQVTVFLDSEGGDKLNSASAPNVGHDMAVIFIEQKPIVTTEIIGEERIEITRIEEERRLISVATIQSALGYQFRITGLDLREAQELALLLRAGALAAPMYFVEERTVGASLGAENIKRGMISVTIGFVLVLIFMVVYYKVFGVIANIALTLNLVILVSVMSIMEATLTLPGIAGIVLTVGMAVDANVLIFSRIREELQRSSPLIAIQAGYDRAFLTILDANITTLFVALILFAIGSGPVAGFAVTLSIGLLTSMFTAIFVSRGLVHLVYGRRRSKKVWI